MSLHPGEDPRNETLIYSSDRTYGLAGSLALEISELYRTWLKAWSVKKMQWILEIFEHVLELALLSENSWYLFTHTLIPYKHLVCLYQVVSAK